MDFAFQIRCYTASASALVFWSMWPTVVGATPLAKLTIHLDAPPTCPGYATLYAQLRRDLDGSHAPDERLTIDARIQRLGPESWKAIVFAKGDDGSSERELVAGSCQALFDATSLIIAILIDPETAAIHARTISGVTVAPFVNNATNGSSPQQPTTVASQTSNEVAGSAGSHGIATASPIAATEPTAGATETPAAPPVEDQSPGAPLDVLASAGASTSATAPKKTKTQTEPVGAANVAPRPSPWQLGGLAAAWAAADAGSLPSPTAAFGGAVGVTYGPWRAESRLGWWMPRSRALGAGAHPDAIAEFGMVAGAVQLCVRGWRHEALSLSPCAGVEGARRSGTAPILLPSLPSHPWDWAITTGVLGHYEVDKDWGIRTDLALLRPLRRPTFGYFEDNVPVGVFRPAWLQWRAAVGLEWSFR